MYKKGISEYLAIYLGGALIITIVVVVGYLFISNLGNRGCETGILNFQAELSGLDQTLRPGTVEQRTFRVPCGATEVFLLDNNPSVDPDTFANRPLVKNTLQTGGSENVFLYKDTEFLGSFDAGLLDIAYPSYSCLHPRNGEVSFTLEGKGRNVLTTPTCGQHQCRALSQHFDSDHATAIFLQSSSMSLGIPANPTDQANTLARAAQTSQVVDVIKTFDYCDGKTTVDITFVPKQPLTVFEYFELYPSTCVSSLSSLLDSTPTISPSDGQIEISDDMMIWRINNLNEEFTISYTLSHQLSESCMDAIQTAAVSLTI